MFWSHVTEKHHQVELFHPLQFPGAPLQPYDLIDRPSLLQNEFPIFAHPAIPPEI